MSYEGINKDVIERIKKENSMPYRTMCDALDEMRKFLAILEKKNPDVNIHHLGLLIEEIQSMGNRMEAALYAQKDLSIFEAKIKEKKKELAELKKQVSDIKPPSCS